MESSICKILVLVAAAVSFFSHATPAAAQEDLGRDKTTNRSEFLKAVFQGIEQQIPSLKCLPVITDPTKSAESWKGDSFASAGFVWRDKPEKDNGMANLALRVTIHHYASAQDLEKDVQENLFKFRQATPESPELYKGGALYRWKHYEGPLVFQRGLYVCELMPFNEETPPAIVLAALDTIIPSLSK